MITGTRSQFQAAIDKARKLGGPRAMILAETVMPNGARRFGVRGERGTDYLVTVDRRGEVSACSCYAGQRETPCKHAAVIWMKVIAERAAGVAVAGSADRRESAVYRRASGRGVGLALAEPDDEPSALDGLRAAGWRG